MKYNFLIDECLSPDLVQMALDAGYLATCVRNLGLLGMKDWQLIQRVVAGDYTLVTNNACDFRGVNPPVPGGLHAQQPIHCGLVCLGSQFPLDIQRQCILFGYALDKLGQRDDLINRALEVYEEENGEVLLSVYRIPDGDI